MSSPEPKVIVSHIYILTICDKLELDQSFVKEVDRMREWERQLSAVCEKMQKNQATSLRTVVKILIKQDSRLTQRELLRISRTTTGLELDEAAMKKALPLAVHENVLTGGRGRKSKGYGLPWWD
jgi:hypothetical protein